MRVRERDGIVDSLDGLRGDSPNGVHEGGQRFTAIERVSRPKGRDEAEVGGRDGSDDRIET